ncbi:uncharacterized protein LOC126390142 [Epinephelus moara]|uniref:uncharacterized protein LOC126390142 n=1 Tax=Epinephelus moara TaxID=300413 RepID=UPI00214E22DB|nr:uncharacterized protein LOC126390142 [Epinephelus moara]
MEEDECLAEFRVRKCDLPVLADVLMIPDKFICDQRSVVGGMEGLCMLLKRLAYPCRYSDMMARFGQRQVPVLSMATNCVLKYIYDRHHHRITQWNHGILNPAALQTYADRIHQMGARLDNCFGFIDCTVQPIARPGTDQRTLYNGHKRVHSLKFQATALPSGLTGNIYGPVEGRKHDSGMLADSNLLSVLEEHAISPSGQRMCVYGDPAYPLRVHLQAPFRHGQLTPQMQAFNKAMNEVRVSVEWLFGDIANYFKFMDFKKNLKIKLSSVGKLYVVSALLRNALTCLYGNQTSQFFGLDPPHIQEYFS